MTGRQALRSATAGHHDRVDALFSAFDLSSPDGYCAFLTAQAEPFLSTEAALERGGIAQLVSDWPERKRARLIFADLADVCSCESRNPSTTEISSVLLLSQEHSEAALLGALYVLEGSRLGGAFLKRAVPDHFPTRFLSAPQSPGNWRKLLEMLDGLLYEPARIEAAVGTARAVFECFEQGARHVLERVEA